MKFHDELNQKLFNGEELKPEVKDKLKEIANAFIEFIEVPDEAIADIVLTGSMMSYNYTKFSDIDLHLIVDFEKVHEDCPIVEGYLLSKKSEFNKNHDIFIYGIPVEVYAEDISNNNVHNGLYSLKQDKWLDYPHKIEPTDNDAAVEAKYNEFKDLAEIIDDSEEASALIKKIREMRKSGLEEGGEFSTENLTFKKLRDNGIIGKLMEIKKKEIDKQLSLESYQEGLAEPTGELAVFAKRLFSNVNNKPEKDFKSETDYRLSLEDAEKWINKDMGYDRPGIIYQIRDKKGNILKEVKWTDVYNTTEEYDKVIKYLYHYGNMEQIAYVLRLANPNISQKILNKKIEDLKKAKEQEENKRNHMYFDGATWQNESVNKKVSEDEFQKAWDLIVEGMSHLCMDSYYDKFEKKMNKLPKIKSDKIKIKKAKELLLDMQGRLIDEQYDDYNHKVDEFLSKKNESVNEKVEETKNYKRTRLCSPKSCKPDSFRTKTVNKDGDKIILCQDKKTGKLKAQSKLEKKSVKNEGKMSMKEEFIVRAQSEFDGATEYEVCKSDNEVGAIETGTEELKKLCTEKKFGENPMIRIYNRQDGQDKLIKELKPQDLEESINHLTDKIDYVNTQLKDLIQSIMPTPELEPALAENFDVSKLKAKINEALG